MALVYNSAGRFGVSLVSHTGRRAAGSVMQPGIKRKIRPGLLVSNNNPVGCEMCFSSVESSRDSDHTVSVADFFFVDRSDGDGLSGLARMLPFSAVPPLTLPGRGLSLSGGSSGHASCLRTSWSGQSLRVLEQRVGDLHAVSSH